jgi:gamma-tubulin complex component 3
MTFFIRQLQYFCHLEVISCSWQELEKTALKKEGDLDSLIEAHRVYLKRLTSKALLSIPRRGGRHSHTDMLGIVRRIFETLLIYQETAVRVYAYRELLRCLPLGRRTRCVIML